MKRNDWLLVLIAPLCLYAGFRSADALHAWLAPEATASVSASVSASTSAATAVAPSMSDPLSYASDETAAELTVVVNKTYPLPESYIPPDLTAPKIPFIFDGEHEKRLLREAAARAIEALFAAAEQDGIQLYGASGYRSYDTQKALFAFNSRTKGKDHAERYSALPGTSEHQTGLAMDVTARSVDLKLLPSFGETEEGRWLAAHAHQYGFVIRYPPDKEAVTGYAYEPWHIRYVGIPAASAAYHYNLTLEEIAAGAVPANSQ